MYGLRGYNPSNDPYEAFSTFFQTGGCLYADFTPEACTPAVAAVQKGWDDGSIHTDPKSMGHPEFSFNLYGPGTASVGRNSSEAAAMVNQAARALGISKGAPVAVAPVASTSATTSTQQAPITSTVAVSPAATPSTGIPLWGWLAGGAAVLLLMKGGK